MLFPKNYGSQSEAWKQVLEEKGYKFDPEAFITLGSGLPEDCLLNGAYKGKGIPLNFYEKSVGSYGAVQILFLDDDEAIVCIADGIDKELKFP